MAGLNLQVLAARTVSYRVLGGLERGRGNPTLETLFELAKHLNVTVSDLLDVEARPRGHVRVRERPQKALTVGRKAQPRAKSRAK